MNTDTGAEFHSLVSALLPRLNYVENLLPLSVATIHLYSKKFLGDNYVFIINLKYPLNVYIFTCNFNA